MMFVAASTWEHPRTLRSTLAVLGTVFGLVSAMRADTVFTMVTNPAMPWER
ncbi:hypothetical protein G3I13_19960 [Streptomyces sp. SID6673]|nr:hypothetical protein [Streptomyces sp. SID11726]NEB26614.1 hypothetical protein [Streptomyces sp. SID6673]